MDQDLFEIMLSNPEASENDLACVGIAPIWVRFQVATLTKQQADFIRTVMKENLNEVQK